MRVCLSPCPYVVHTCVDVSMYIFLSPHQLTDSQNLSQVLFPQKAPLWGSAKERQCGLVGEHLGQHPSLTSHGPWVSPTPRDTEAAVLVVERRAGDNAGKC